MGSVRAVVRPASSAHSIVSHCADAGATYDGRAATYDRLIGSRLYNRAAWSTDVRDYARFASAAVASGDGRLLDVAAGTAVATAAAYRASARPVVLLDRSRDMLSVAGQRLSVDGTLPPTITLVQADAFALPFAPGSFETVLSLGFLHLVEDVAGFVAALRAQLAPGGRLFCTSLVAQTRRGRAYLQLLHRAGEVAAPRSAAMLSAALGGAPLRVRGCMAYVELGSDGP
jgi:ubiquinone/menaquinone biosynthesis C-methylase UbiE